MRISATIRPKVSHTVVMNDNHQQPFRWVNPHAETVVVFATRSPEYKTVGRYLTAATLVAELEEVSVLSDGEWFWDTNYLEVNLVKIRTIELELCLKILEVGGPPRKLNLEERIACDEFVTQSLIVDQALEYKLTGDIEPIETSGEGDLDV